MTAGPQLVPLAVATKQKRNGAHAATVPAGLTEDELAAEFTRRHRHELRYVAMWSAWMRWRGAAWQRETTLEAFDLARAVCRDAGEKIPEPGLRAKVLSASTRAAVENLARSDRAHAATTDQWDPDPFTIGTPGTTGADNLRGSAP
jgi:putative DNA primase/helicase